MLANIRNTLRPLISLDAEYRLRRAIYSVIPHGQAGERLLVHACVWKTGSQWIRLVLSDPRVYQIGGHKPYVWSHLRGTRRDDFLSHRSRALVTAAYATYEEVHETVGDGFRSIFVVRNPIDLLYSWYVSTRYTHDPTPAVERRRELMRGMSDEDGVLYMIKDFLDEFGPIFNSWVDAKERYTKEVRFVRFEDLVGEASAEEWLRVAEHFELNITADRLMEVVNTYPFAELKKVRARGGAVAGKYKARSGVQQFVQMDGRVMAEIERTLGPMCQATGY